MQEVCLVAWRKFSELDDPDSFRPWVCVISRYEVLMYRRKKARDRFVLDEEIALFIAEEGFEELVVRERQLEALESCLDKLPVPNSVATKRSLPLYARTLLAIATIVIVALTTSLYVQRASYDRKFSAVSVKSDRRIGKIIGLGGVVMWTGDGGRITGDLSVGTGLTGGTIEGASPTSWVELECLDGSTVTVSGDSWLTFSEFGQKVLHLKEGNVASKVSP